MITEDGYYVPARGLEMTAWTASYAMRAAGARAYAEAHARRHEPADAALYVYGAMRHNRPLLWDVLSYGLPFVVGVVVGVML